MFVIRTQRRDDHIIDIRKRKAHYNCFYDDDEDDDDDNNNTNYILPKWRNNDEYTSNAANASPSLYEILMECNVM